MSRFRLNYSIETCNLKGVTREYKLVIRLRTRRSVASQVWAVSACGKRDIPKDYQMKLDVVHKQCNVLTQKCRPVHSLVQWALHISRSRSLLEYFSDCLLLPCYTLGKNGGSAWEFRKMQATNNLPCAFTLELLEPVLNDWYWYMVISLPDHMTQLPQESIKMNCTSAYVSDFFSLPGPVHTPMVQ